jgi:hypothetical protein
MNQLSNHIKLKLLDYSIGKKNTITTSENIEKTLYSDIDSNLPIDYSRNMKNDTERNLKCDTDRNIINNEQNKEDEVRINIFNILISKKFYNKLSLIQIEDFIFSQLPDNQILMTNVRVYKSCFNNIFKRNDDFKNFNFEVEILLNNNIFLIGKTVNNFSKLKIKLYITNNHKEYKYIGKIVSNTIRSKFKVYFGEKGKYILNMKIKYAINFLGLFGMRKMIVKIIDKKKEIIFNNKIPEWDIKYQKYLLDFNQRVRLTSKRNFILEDKNNKKVLQCGKIDNNIYALDYESPLNPFQAFSISITSIVNKIFCE